MRAGKVHLRPTYGDTPARSQHPPTEHAEVVRHSLSLCDSPVPNLHIRPDHTKENTAP